MPNNYELTDNGLVTTAPEILVPHLGKVVSLYQDGEWIRGILDGDDLGWREVCVSYPLIKEAYQPIEGEGYVYDSPVMRETEALFIGCSYKPTSVVLMRNPDIKYYHKRVLNMVIIRAELRDLVRHVEEWS